MEKYLPYPASSMTVRAALSTCQPCSGLPLAIAERIKSVALSLAGAHAKNFAYSSGTFAPRKPST